MSQSGEQGRFVLRCQQALRRAHQAADTGFLARRGLALVVFSLATWGSGFFAGEVDTFIGDLTADLGFTFAVRDDLAVDGAERALDEVVVACDSRASRRSRLLR